MWTVINDRQYATVGEVLDFIQGYGLNPDTSLKPNYILDTIMRWTNYVDNYVQTSWRLLEVTEIKLVDYGDMIDAYSHVEISMSYGPIREVVSVEYYDLNTHTWVPVPVTSYSVLGFNTIILGVHSVYSSLYPMRIRITYRFGNDSDPPLDIRNAVIRLVASELISNWEFSVVGPGGDVSPSRTFRVQTWRSEAHEILNRHRRIVVIKY